MIQINFEKREINMEAPQAPAPPPPRVCPGDLVYVRGFRGGPWPVLATGGLLDVPGLYAFLGGAAGPWTTCRDSEEPPWSAGHPAKYPQTTRACLVSALETRAEAQAREAAELWRAGAKGRARLRWWRKNRNDLGRVLCGVGGLLLAIVAALILLLGR